MAESENINSDEHEVEAFRQRFRSMRPGLSATSMTNVANIMRAEIERQARRRRLMWAARMGAVAAVVLGALALNQTHLNVNNEMRAAPRISESIPLPREAQATDTEVARVPLDKYSSLYADDEKLTGN